MIKTKIAKTLQKEKIELLVGQKYSLEESKDESITNFFDALKIATEKVPFPEWLSTLNSVKVDISAAQEEYSLDLPCLIQLKKRSLLKMALKRQPIQFPLQKKGDKEEAKEYVPRGGGEKKEEGCYSFVSKLLVPSTAYILNVKAKVKGKEISQGIKLEFTSPGLSDFSESVWRDCPDSVNGSAMYYISNNNRTATFYGPYCCTAIGSTPLPHNKVTSWSIKILKSRSNDGSGIYIGVAPSDINQNKDNNKKCGWYFRCYDSKLYSGPPHNYNGWKEYGPRKGKEKDNTFTQETVWEL